MIRTLPEQFMPSNRHEQLAIPWLPEIWVGDSCKLDMGQQQLDLCPLPMMHWHLRYCLLCSRHSACLPA